MTQKDNNNPFNEGIQSKQAVEENIKQRLISISTEYIKSVTEMKRQNLTKVPINKN